MTRPVAPAPTGPVGVASAAACGDPRRITDAIARSEAAVPGVEFRLLNYRCVADYGYAEISTPSGGASAILQRVKGKWKVLDLGSGGLDLSLLPSEAVAALAVPPQ
jgi:hypothetical protein